MGKWLATRPALAPSRPHPELLGWSQSLQLCFGCSKPAWHLGPRPPKSEPYPCRVRLDAPAMAALAGRGAATTRAALRRSGALGGGAVA